MKRFCLSLLSLVFCIHYSQAQLLVSESHGHPSCHGGSGGWISVSVSGGLPPYVYQWSNGRTGTSLSGLAAGVYQLSVGDAGQPVDPLVPWNYVLTGSNHILLYPEVVMVNEQPITPGDYIGVFFAWQGNLICGGYTCYTGGLDVVAAWADDPATTGKEGFSTGEAVQWKIWRASDGQTVDMVPVYDMSGMFPDGGSFSPNGMSGLVTLSGTVAPIIVQQHAVLAVTIQQPLALVAAAQAGEIVCAGEQTQVLLSALGGTPPYYGTGTFMAGAGLSTYTVTDGAGCVAQTQLSLTDPEPMSQSFIQGDIWLHLHYQHGTPPISYLWSNGGIGEEQFYLSPGTYTVTAQDALGCVAVLPVAVGPGSQTVDFPEGWSLFSTYLIPQNSSIAAVLQPLGPGVVAKSGAGLVYWPQFNVNGIGAMQTGAGYQVRVPASQSLTITGSLLNPGQIILSLPAGWSLLGYLHPAPTPLESMLAPLGGNLIIAKNGTGQIYWPQFNVNSISQLLPGQAYLIKLAMADSFSYPGLRPEVSTASATGVTTHSVVVGGTILHPGGASVTEQGVCLNTSGNPVITDTHAAAGLGANSFFVSLDGLLPVTTYYARAYATNSHGTGYGNEVQFTTLVALPGVNTAPVSTIGSTSATGGGEVTSNGVGPVTARGVCWNTTGSPTISGSHTTNGSGLGSFTSSMTNLAPATTYFVRAYASNSAGTQYGSEIVFTTSSFVCGVSTLADYDGNVYNTVQIGSQCWMRENMKTTHYADGTSLVDGANAGDYSGNYTTKYWFVYGDNLANKSTYGLLYTWAAAMNGAASSSTNPSGVQGVCPTGWHLPSDSEWTQMENYLGGSIYAGGALKEAGTSHWLEPNSGATNSSGFTALPGGYRSPGWFNHIGDSGFWWTATQYGTTNAWLRELYYANFDVTRYNFYSKDYGFSVRCLRNN